MAVAVMSPAQSTIRQQDSLLILHHLVEDLTKTTEEIILHTNPFRKYIAMEPRNFTYDHVQGYTECSHRPCPAEKFDRKTLCLLVTAVYGC